MGKATHTNVPWILKDKKTEEPQPINIGGKRFNNYICLVDHYRRPSRKRNTAGRYRVGAKNEKDARQMLQAAIGFGSILIYMVENEGLYGDIVPYGTCVKETFDSTTQRYIQTPAKNAIDRQSQPCDACRNTID
ncbi:MAG: hypothetical protein HDQ88_02880 [Clostridia bacterium]|nr:hypothetical protein [Clostridia bacterium]